MKTFEDIRKARATEADAVLFYGRAAFAGGPAFSPRLLHVL